MLDDIISDHNPIITYLKAPSLHQKHNVITFRNYNDFSDENFCKDLTKELDELIRKPIGDVHEDWSKFKEIFQTVSNKHAPIKTARLKDRRCPWMTKDIIALMYERDKLHSDAKTSKNAELWNQYQRLRNLVTTKISDLKTKYFFDLDKDYSKNPKKRWEEIRKVFPLRKSKQAVFPDIDSNVLNKHFANLGEIATSELPEKTGMPKMKGIPSIYTFALNPVSYADVLRHLKALPNKSSNDVLNMDSYLLKTSAPIIANFVTYLINLSITKQDLPDDFKLSRVTPIYKGSGPTNDISSYRPISVTCHVSKVLEHFINKQLISYLSKHSFISNDQSAYLKHHSTVASLHNVVDDFLQNIDDGLFTAVCFLDIAKCFPSIDHKILLYKLDWYRVRGNENMLFKNYLSHRSQTV